jgi:hypothetical protein
MLGDMLRKPLNQEHKMEENYDLILPIKIYYAIYYPFERGTKKSPT